MAKVCAVCGNEIKIFDRAVKMKHSGISLCSNCCDQAEVLLGVAKSAEPEAFNRRFKDEFYEELSKTGYSTFIKSCIKEEFLSIIAEKRNKKLVIKKQFNAGFEECYEKFYTVGLEFAHSFFKPEIIKINGVSATTFAFEWSRGYYEVSLVVIATLVSNGDVTTITTHCSGGIDGPGPDEIHILNEFWQKFRELETKWLAEKEVEPELNKPGRIGILGGSFDPIHIGHQSLGEAAIKELELKELIVMPAKIQPFKKDKNVTPAFHRKTMAELAFIGRSNVEVSTYEMEQDKLSYTYDTLTYLKKYYPDDQLFFIMGTDSFLQLESWHKGIELLENYSFAVSVRPGYKEKELEETINKYKNIYGSEVEKIETKMPDISSTEIRRRLIEGKSVSDLIPESVERYILQNGLYK